MGGRFSLLTALMPLITFSVGYTCGERAVQKEAVKAGVAVYSKGDVADRTFKFKEFDEYTPEQP